MGPEGAVALPLYVLSNLSSSSSSSEEWSQLKLLSGEPGAGFIGNGSHSSGTSVIAGSSSFS
ncbi:hypothetical protein PF008_g24816 [Phytophthora fragariae]|uniref:Uncharacterized protein n=1 Tax=Phytophthora fragariae TaxID=53985 RepID=A0A6G0QLQ2_9STRA|nr:hypothetical protein PF008_g24816 [Phytophthora fragariae]